MGELPPLGADRRPRVSGVVFGGVQHLHHDRFAQRAGHGNSPLPHGKASCGSDQVDRDRARSRIVRGPGRGIDKQRQPIIRSRAPYGIETEGPVEIDAISERHFESWTRVLSRMPNCTDPQRRRSVYGEALGGAHAHADEANRCSIRSSAEDANAQERIPRPRKGRFDLDARSLSLLQEGQKHQARGGGRRCGGDPIRTEVRRHFRSSVGGVAIPTVGRGGGVREPGSAAVRRERGAA